MSTCALHALFRPAKDAPRATRTRPCDQIISETRTPNMAQNLPAPSGFGCGDRQPAIGVPPRFVTVACYHADRTALDWATILQTVGPLSRRPPVWS